MKKIHCKLIFIILSLFLIAGATFAEADDWKIDNVHSNVYFDIRHIYATVRGRFEDFSGTMNFNPENLAQSSITFEVDTNSINTGIPNRDNHLRSEEFFAADTFPVMTFKSSGVSQNQGNQFMLAGDLTIKDKTTKVTVPFTYLGIRENPLKKGQMIAGFETRFTIDRLEYGVGSGKFFKMGAVGNQVDILITLEVLKNI